MLSRGHLAKGQARGAGGQALGAEGRNGMSGHRGGRAAPGLPLSAALALTLAGALWLGANRPAAWTVLAAGALALFTLQAVRDRGDPAALRLWPAARGPALLILAVLAWTLAQALPLPWPALAHPAWAEVAAVPDAEPPSGAISADPHASRHAALRLAGYAALFWIAARAAAEGLAVRWALTWIAAAGAAMAAYGLLAVALAWNPVTGPSAYPGAVTGTFVNRNACALFLGICAMAALARRALDRAHGLVPPVWPLAAACLCLAACLATGSRAGVAATGLGLGLQAWLGARRIALRARLGIALAAAALAAIALAASPVLGPRLAELSLAENQRTEAWRLTLAGIAEAPWTGHGAGAFQDAFRRFQHPGFSGEDWDHAHSTYLQTAFEIGLPAALAFFAALLWIGRTTWRGLAARRRMRPAVILALAVLLAGAAHAAVDFSLEMPANAALLAILLGLGWGLAVQAPAGPADRGARRDHRQ